MAIPVLNLVPDCEGYGVGFGNNVLSVELDGGASNFRLDSIGAAHKTNAIFNCDQNDFDYLMAFFRTEIKQGSLPFYIDLIIDESSLQTYKARIVPNTLKLASHRGLSYQVVCTLEVEALVTDEEKDANTIFLYCFVGFIAFEELFNAIVNIDIPLIFS